MINQNLKNSHISLIDVDILRYKDHVANCENRQLAVCASRFIINKEEITV